MPSLDMVVATLRREINLIDAGEQDVVPKSSSNVSRAIHRLPERTHRSDVQEARWSILGQETTKDRTSQVVLGKVEVRHTSASSVYRPTRRVTKKTPVTFGELTQTSKANEATELFLQGGESRVLLHVAYFPFVTQVFQLGV